MAEQALDTAVSWWPAWLALTVSALIAFNRMIEESGKFASFFGGWTRRIHARAMTRHHIDLAAVEFAEAVEHAVSEARKTWQTEGNEALRALDERLDFVSDITAQQKRDLDELRFTVRCMTAYTEYEALWHHRLRVQAATAAGDCLPIDLLPKHVDYYEFEAMYRANTNWRNWGEL